MNSESLLHYLWKNSIFTSFDFKTIDGEPLTIIHPGYAHQDAGPDFKQAIIKINQILWAGDVELHIRTSDWFKHHHDQDDKYKSIILHVVFEHDLFQIKEKTHNYSILELKNHISQQLIDNYEMIRKSHLSLPCASFIKKTKEEKEDYMKLLFASLYERMITERLSEKQSNIYKIYTEVQGDWNATLFRFLTSNFGFKTNQSAFELMSKSIPYRIIRNHSENHLQVYALLFGQSGMLDITIEDDNYYSGLQNEYCYLKKKYNLVPIHLKNWNLLRLRPSNFPCIRIAQLSEILHHYPNLFHYIETQTEMAQFEHIFMSKPDPYWETHYHFGKQSNTHTVLMGKSTFNLIVINTIIPVLYAYGVFCGRSDIQERAIDLYTSIESEDNHLITKYRESGFSISSAQDSQAILYLSKHYCSQKKCLECSLGQKIISLS